MDRQGGQEERAFRIRSVLPGNAGYFRRRGVLFRKHRGNEEVYDLLTGYEYSLLARSEEELADPDAMGVGNYVIELENSTGEVVFAVFHMDTHGKFYIDPAGNTSGADGYSDQGYVGLTQKQIEWYESKVKGYSEKGIKSAIFMHVPNYAYRELAETPGELNEYGVPSFDDDQERAKGLVPQSMRTLNLSRERECTPPDGTTGLWKSFPAILPQLSFPWDTTTTILS